MGMLGKDPLQGMPWGQQPVPGGHHNPCLSFPNREMLAGCLGTPVSPGSTTALGQPPVTSLLAQNIHPQLHVAAKKNYGGSGGGEEPAGFGHKPQHPRLAAQGLLQEPSIPLGPASSTRKAMPGGIYEVWSCAAAIQLWDTPSAHLAPNPCPEQPGAGDARVPVAMESPWHCAAPG